MVVYWTHAYYNPAKVGASIERIKTWSRRKQLEISFLSSITRCLTGSKPCIVARPSQPISLEARFIKTTTAQWTMTGQMHVPIQS
jgi:hypothetical protein